MEFDDVPVSVDDVLAGAWWPSRYGAGDERGTLNEVTPEKTAAALRLLDLSRPVNTYTLSETLFNGFPAYGDRAYQQRRVDNGFAGSDISRSWGTTHCGMESQGPVVTRGVLIDVIGEKVDSGRTDDF